MEDGIEEIGDVIGFPTEFGGLTDTERKTDVAREGEGRTSLSAK